MKGFVPVSKVKERKKNIINAKIIHIKYNTYKFYKEINPLKIYEININQKTLH